MRYLALFLFFAATAVRAAPLSPAACSAVRQQQCNASGRRRAQTNKRQDIAKLTALTATISGWHLSRIYIIRRTSLTEKNLSQGELRHAHLINESRRMLKINRWCRNPVQVEIVPENNSDYFGINLAITTKFTLSTPITSV